jgi:aryl-alcohol dehydrogenase-like predicted oxidoreductase
MRYVEVGGLRVSVIGLGAWQLGDRAWGWGTDLGPAEAQAILARARDLGITLVDTAESYGGGESERQVGPAQAAPGARESTVLATKVSGTWPSEERVVAAAHGSLRRLGTSRIDLYQVHFYNPLVAPEATMAGMRRLQRDGIVGHVGVSNYPLARWIKAEAALGGPVLSNQARYNLLSRRPERGLLTYAANAGRLVIAYSPLAQGVLGGRFTAANPPGGIRGANLLFSAENLRRAEPVLGALRELAAAHQATPAQVALAWVIAHPNVVAIPGARSVAQLEANAAAADLALAPDELAHLTAAADRFEPAWAASAAEVARRRLKGLVDAARSGAGPSGPSAGPGPGSPGRTSPP